MPMRDIEAAARLAGERLLEFRRRGTALDVEAKGFNDLVTAADREAEELIIRRLAASWPGVGFLAEESGATGGGSGDRWIIDPLDGTTNFVHGYPCWGVSIALERGGRIVAGAVFDPERDEMFTAESGGGAFLNGKRIQVSGVMHLADALLVTGFPFRRLSEMDEFLAGLKVFLARTQGVRRDGSAALDLAAVAAGRLDGFWEKGLAPWDVAAGGLLVREAGGVVSDYSGGDRWLDGEEIVAATPGIHAEMVAILGQCARADRGAAPGTGP
jgi:myo-inositol-1(or 4)-monophosphatase